MTQRNVSKATVPDRRAWLPTPAFVIAAVRLSKALKDAHSKEPSIIQEIYHLTPCTSTQRKLENEQRKGHRILIWSCWTTDIWLFEYYRKWGIGPDQSHHNKSWLWSRLQTTLAQIIHITPKWIYCTLYWKIFHRSRFLCNLRLLWKNITSLTIDSN